MKFVEYLYVIILFSIPQFNAQETDNCIGIVGIFTDEGEPFEGVVFKVKEDKTSSINVLISTSSNENEDERFIYVNRDMNFVYEYAQFYCYEVHKKWYRIYLNAPVSSYVWVKKKKRFITYYSLDEITKLQEGRKKSIVSPCGN